MMHDSFHLCSHLSGEQSVVVGTGRPSGVDVEGFCASVHVEWDHDAAMTPLGQLPFFIHFLALRRFWWVETRIERTGRPAK